MLKTLSLIIILALAASAASAEDYLVWSNTNPVKEDCRDITSSIWIEDEEFGNACIRYFKSHENIKSSSVLIELYGDRPNFLDIEVSKIPNNKKSMQIDIAKSISKKFDMKAIVLARPGVYGSSGDHKRRRTQSEYFFTAKAITALKERYELKDVVLLGQSGGATAIAGAFTQNLKGIKCAVLTSGAYSLSERANYIRARNNKPLRDRVDTTGLKDYYDPIEHIEDMHIDSVSKILIVGSKEDINTPFVLQMKYFKRLKYYGHNSILINTVSEPPMHHRIIDSKRVEAVKRCY